MKKVLLSVFIGSIMINVWYQTFAQNTPFQMPQTNIAYTSTGYIHPTILPQFSSDNIVKNYNFGEGGKINWNDFILNKEEITRMQFGAPYNSLSLQAENMEKYNDYYDIDPNMDCDSPGECPSGVNVEFLYNNGHMTMHPDTKVGTYNFSINVCTEGNFKFGEETFPQF